jgi:hypothetical protein
MQASLADQWNSRASSSSACAWLDACHVLALVAGVDCQVESTNCLASIVCTQQWQPWIYAVQAVAKVALYEGKYQLVCGAISDFELISMKCMLFLYKIFAS